MPRWRGRRLVAADTSTLRFGRRASHVARAASADQIAFGLYLPGAEMMLAASLHSVHEGERQMLLQHIDRLSGGDLLLMDRGYPSRWLVAALNARGVGFCMRVEKAGNSGFACVRDFLRSDDDARIVTLAAPDRRDAADYECPAMAQTVRLVRHIASTGRVRVLMTNLLDPMAFPAHEFGDLYHQRWRIEEAFKRLKHRLNLEHVSGLSQQAALHDFAAKIVCDNLQSLSTETALREASLAPTRRINRRGPLHFEATAASAAARRRHRHASARSTTLDRRPDLLAPTWHHQIQATGCTSEIAQIHESEAVLMRGVAKFGGLTCNVAAMTCSLEVFYFEELMTRQRIPASTWHGRAALWRFGAAAAWRPRCMPRTQYWSGTA